MKGKLYENGFSIPTIPTQGESVHNDNNNPTTITITQHGYIPAHASPSQTQKEFWKLLRMHFSALETQSINQCLLNDNYTQKNYAIQRLNTSLMSPLHHPAIAMCSRVDSHIAQWEEPTSPIITDNVILAPQQQRWEAGRSLWCTAGKPTTQLKSFTIRLELKAFPELCYLGSTPFTQAWRHKKW